MSIDVNQIMIQGKVGKNIEVKYAGEMAIGTFSVAVNKWIPSKSENKTTWFNVKILGKLAENMQTKIEKGCTVFCRGEMVIENYEHEGVKKVKTEVLCDWIRVEKLKDTSSGSSDSSDSSSSDDGGENDLPF